MSAPLAIFVDRTGYSTITGQHRRSDQIIELMRSSGFKALTVAGRNRGAGTIAYALSCLLFYARATLIIWIKRPNLIWLPVPWPLIIPYPKSTLVVDQRDDYITNVAKKSVLLAKALVFLSKGICLICEKVIHATAIEKDGAHHYLPTGIQRDTSGQRLLQKDLAPLIYPSSSRLGSENLTKRLQSVLGDVGLVGREQLRPCQIVLIPFVVDQHTKFLHSNRLSDVLSRGGLPVFVSVEPPREDAWFYPLFVTFEQLMSEKVSKPQTTVASVEYAETVRAVIEDRSIDRWIEFQRFILIERTGLNREISQI